MASYICQFLGLAVLSFLDDFVEAEAAIPSDVSILLLSDGVASSSRDVMI
jgi:hypothetical protein